MKRSIMLIVVFSILMQCGISILYASTLGCSDIDGMAVFGKEHGEWRCIGAVTGPGDRDSIANENGAGSKRGADSLSNRYGNFGSGDSPYSAFNRSAGDPPMIVNHAGQIVGYITINPYKTPNIRPDEAIACAQKSRRFFSNPYLKKTVFAK